MAHRDPQSFATVDEHQPRRHARDDLHDKSITRRKFNKVVSQGWGHVVE
jgi:hypothetical protein